MQAEIETYGGRGRGSNPGLPYIYEVEESARKQATAGTPAYGLLER